MPTSKDLHRATITALQDFKALMQKGIDAADKVLQQAESLSTTQDFAMWSPEFKGKQVPDFARASYSRVEETLAALKTTATKEMREAMISKNALTENAKKRAGK